VDVRMDQTDTEPNLKLRPSRTNAPTRAQMQAESEADAKMLDGHGYEALEAAVRMSYRCHVHRDVYGNGELDKECVKRIKEELRISRAVAFKLLRIYDHNKGDAILIWGRGIVEAEGSGKGGWDKFPTWGKAVAQFCPSEKREKVPKAEPEPKMIDPVEPGEGLAESAALKARAEADRLAGLFNALVKVICPVVGCNCSALRTTRQMADAPVVCGKHWETLVAEVVKEAQGAAPVDLDQDIADEIDAIMDGLPPDPPAPGSIAHNQAGVIAHALREAAKAVDPAERAALEDEVQRCLAEGREDEAQAAAEIWRGDWEMVIQRGSHDYSVEHPCGQPKAAPTVKGAASTRQDEAFDAVTDFWLNDLKPGHSNGLSADQYKELNKHWEHLYLTLPRDEWKTAAHAALADALNKAQAALNEPAEMPWSALQREVEAEAEATGVDPEVVLQAKANEMVAEAMAKGGRDAVKMLLAKAEAMAANAPDDPVIAVKVPRGEATKKIMPILDRSGIPILDIGLGETPEGCDYDVVEIVVEAERAEALRDAFGAMVLAEANDEDEPAPPKRGPKKEVNGYPTVALADILQAADQVPPECWLSDRAMADGVNRAERRGKLDQWPAAIREPMVAARDRLRAIEIPNDRLAAIAKAAAGIFPAVRVRPRSEGGCRVSAHKDKIVFLEHVVDHAVAEPFMLTDCDAHGAFTRGPDDGSPILEITCAKIRHDVEVHTTGKWEVPAAATVEIAGLTFDADHLRAIAHKKPVRVWADKRGALHAVLSNGINFYVRAITEAA